VYSIDQVNSPETELHDGLEVTASLDEALCQELPITGVLRLAPDQADWRLPNEYATRARSGTVSADVWLRIGSGPTPEWARLDAGSGAFTVRHPIREALEAFPIVGVRVKGVPTGDIDFALEASPIDTEGEGCIPGEPASGNWYVTIRNDGTAITPVRASVEVTVPGAAVETRDLRWTRGLFPTEDLVLGEFTPGTTLTLDPSDDVDELDEANNEQILTGLPPLVCVPV
jgi:hypothetical protein